MTFRSEFFLFIFLCVGWSQSAKLTMQNSGKCLTLHMQGHWAELVCFSKVNILNNFRNDFQVRVFTYLFFCVGWSQSAKLTMQNSGKCLTLHMQGHWAEHVCFSKVNILNNFRNDIHVRVFTYLFFLCWLIPVCKTQLCKILESASHCTCRTIEPNMHVFLM